MNRFEELFGASKPIIAMLHLKSDVHMDMASRAKQEIALYYDNGVDAVLVENYFGSVDDCQEVLAYLQAQYPDKPYGVNVLGDWYKAFQLAQQYNAAFLQIDSVCGHLSPGRDPWFAKELACARQKSRAAVLGGVRFKYQPVNSGRTLEEDLQLGMQRCDAIVVTGDGTGRPTPPDKLYEFRKTVGPFPLIVGAGVTNLSIEPTLRDADGAIIGSWFKDNHKDHGDVLAKHVREIVQKARRARSPSNRTGA